MRVGGLSALAAGLHTLDLSHTRLTTGQLQAIFTSIIEANDLKLRKLNLSWNDLSSVSASAVSQAAARLEEVALSYSRLTVSQIQEVLVVVSSSQEHIKLARLDLQGNNISTLSPRILSRAIIRLQADLCNIRVN